MFTGVTISSTMHPYDSGESDGDARVRFLGTYASQSFSGEDKSILFLGAANTLFYPLDVSGVNDDSWYSLDGRRLDGKPTRAGVYINKGIKVVMK